MSIPVPPKWLRVYTNISSEIDIVNSVKEYKKEINDPKIFLDFEVDFLAGERKYTRSYLKTTLDRTGELMFYCHRIKTEKGDEIGYQICEMDATPCELRIKLNKRPRF